jgi:hypothetical protein
MGKFQVSIPFLNLIFVLSLSLELTLILLCVCDPENSSVVSVVVKLRSRGLEDQQNLDFLLPVTLARRAESLATASAAVVAACTSFYSCLVPNLW